MKAVSNIRFKRYESHACKRYESCKGFWMQAGKIYCKRYEGYASGI